MSIRLLRLVSPSTALLLGLAAHAAATPAAPITDIVARWKGRAVEAPALEQAFGPGVVAALGAWAPWAAAHGYVAHVEDAGRVVLFLADDARGQSKELALVSRTCDAVEELLFGPPRQRPEGVPPRPFVEGPAVMVHTRDEAEYGSLLDHAATLEPSLGSWVEHGKKLTGFTLVKPLASGWATKAAKRVEWNPENEVVHRLTSLLLLRQFGEVPYWLLAGTSWHVELERCKDVYCFPYRDEFVYAVEHTAWPKELRALFAQDRAEFLAGLVAWRRGTYDGARAKEAWGFARFAAGRPGALAAVLAELAELRRTDGVRRFDDGRWELIVGWEPSVDQTRAILAKHLGEDFEARAIASFRSRS